MKSTKLTDASSVSQISRPRFKGKGKRESDNGTYIEQEDDYSRLILKPPDQLQLTEQELKEEFTRILTSDDPRAPKNLVVFDYKTGSFIPSTSSNHVAVHFSCEGSKIHVDSEEAKRQLQLRPVETVTSSSVEREVTSDDEQEEADEAKDGNEEKKKKKAFEQPSNAAKQKKKLTNQFNFTERGTQTYNNPPRDKTTFTDPPPTVDFEGNVNQWSIHDAYQEDFERNHGKDKKQGKEIGGMKQELVETPAELCSLKSAKIIERMVCQNMFNEVAMDFKYYEDLSDEFRDPKGTLLPLWSFKFEKLKHLCITALCWSKLHFDLFAASFGSYEFEKQESGAVLYYSLKNPSYPEHVFTMPCGVMCLDLHPKYPYLAVVGLHDGNVAVFDVIRNRDGPVFISDAKTGKHLDIVWQVKWQEEDGDFKFFSVSGDGQVLCWTILKNELISRVIIQLSLDKQDNLNNHLDTIPVPLNASGTTFDFHPSDDQLYVVGTEEGMVHLCAKNQTSRYLGSYEAHSGPVHKVVWNHYHPAVFMTCSYDWTIKIWDKSISSRVPLLVFDLRSPVSDVEWSPYSSTVFAAVTIDGKVHVYDLNVSKYESLCEQQIGKRKKSKLTHISFNPKQPVVLVGNERGAVRSLKLSPNLRKMPKEKKNQEQLKEEDKDNNRRQNEVEKMEKILSMVRPSPPNHHVSNGNKIDA